VGLGKFVDLEKENFIGKEALIAADKKCKTWGIRVKDGIALKGDSLKIKGENVGKVTSSTWSPYQVCGVGIVQMNNYNLGPGTVIEVICIDGEIRTGELCKLPMYDSKGEIVRGINKEIPLESNPWKRLSK